MFYKKRKISSDLNPFCYPNIEFNIGSNFCHFNKVPSKHRKVSFNLDLTKPLFRRGDFSSNEEKYEDFSENTNTTNSSQIKPKLARTQGIKKIKKDSTASKLEKRNSTPNIKDNMEANVQRNGFKSYARKSFKKIAFRRHCLNEPCGTVWLNARRPSIRAELNLLQLKSNMKFQLPVKRKTNSESGDEQNDSSNRKTNMFSSFLKLIFRKKSSSTEQ